MFELDFLNTTSASYLSTKSQLNTSIAGNLMNSKKFLNHQHIFYQQRKRKENTVFYLHRTIV